jgi:hypothetical protein
MMVPLSVSASLATFTFVPTTRFITCYVFESHENDRHERRLRAAMTRYIYALAGEVVIWLGEDDEGEGGTVLGIIQEIRGLNRQWRVNNADEGELKTTRLHRMRQHASFFFRLADSRPWFSRVWILELTMAKNDPCVVCGWRRVPWSALVPTWKAIAKGGADRVYGHLGLLPQEDVSSPSTIPIPVEHLELHDPN